MKYRMTEAQKKAYEKGVCDRHEGKRMADTFTMQPHVSNAYINGYRAASESYASS